jgi:hypothetical protein
LATFANTKDESSGKAPYQQYGTVIVDQSPPNVMATIKEILIDIPHLILFDSQTGEQGLAIFQGTDAWSVVISRKTRKPNVAPSCQDGYSFKLLMQLTMRNIHSKQVYWQFVISMTFMGWTILLFNPMAWEAVHVLVITFLLRMDLCHLKYLDLMRSCNVCNLRSCPVPKQMDSMCK